MTGLKFYPDAHRYKLDGQWVGSVTTALGVLDKPGLRKWAARSVAEYVADHREAVEHLYEAGNAPMVAALKEIPFQRRDDAATKGTKFHAIAEAILLGQDVDIPPELSGHVESALAFMAAWDIKPIVVEQPVASREHKYAGTPDLIADHNRGPRAIFDWKSGKAIYASAAFQLAAYSFAEFYGEDGDEHSVPDLGIESAYGVHIRADGYDVYPLRFGPDVFAEFLTVLDAYRINKRAEGNWKQPGTGYVGLPLPIELSA